MEIRHTYRETRQRTGLRLDAIDLRKYSHPILASTTLLNDISLSFLPNEFIVIAGVSGGGKSTLMDALNGQRRAKGKVLVDGVDLYKNYDAFKNLIGYVPQDDIVHVDLTVWEAFIFAAQLRVPFLSISGQQQWVEAILQHLHLLERKNVPIKQLSGGQRKRVSIGVELISNPSLFFLDEATSGLDPGTELQIMELLRFLSNMGSTVILITHATKNVAIADQVVFLAKGGRLAYVRPPRLALDYFGVQDFDGIYDLVERQLTPAQWEERFKSSGYYKRFVSDRLQSLPQQNQAPTADKPNLREQVVVLCRRNLSILLKNKLSLALMLLGAPILGSLNFILWKPDLFSTKTGNAGQSISMLFVVVVMAIMSGSLATMPEIAKERPIYRRERSVGLGLPPYIISKLVVAFVLALYQSAVLLHLMLSAVNVPGASVNTGAMYFTLFLASFGSMVLGLIVSAISPNPSVAPLIILIVLVFQIVFGGGIQPTENLSSNPDAKALSQVMLSKYSFENLVLLSGMGADVADDFCWQKSETQRKKLPTPLIAQCNCYNKNVFTKCNFPGLGKIKRTSSLNNDLLKANLLIQSILDGYERVFYTDVAHNNWNLIYLISGMISILFMILFLKG
ncbi:ATP-binding cassette domain-containing protein [Anabaena azotica]|uniref:ATP-binding cassette domain-containing protein n=1 Tax=Anabaena azotica FACHB-119 TaxID=947527 RepID=A0ABR8DEI8_9NOST|nr:ATP-binding cassette domain-containing protein [Anabaena azotica]MBD2505524.1 ATP-binding cassette domain-containing protein [Anabaena azotica FACHB-119]